MAMTFRIARGALTNCLADLTTVTSLCPQRFFASRGPCAPDDSPRCAPGKIDPDSCEDPREKTWFNPKCCLDPCIDAFPRFDDLYYRESDKSKRKYMQTWVECPEIKILPKRVCCFEQVQYPPMERRPRKECPKTACAQMSEDFMLWMKCRSAENKKCPKTVMPCCRGARNPPKCNCERRPSDCKKRCTPYPSYSECSRPVPRPLRLKECSCCKVGPWCSFGHLPVFKW